MRFLILAILALLLVCSNGEAARRKTNCNGVILVERGRPRELAHRATTFNGVTRFGRALGGGPHGFSAPSSASGPVSAPPCAPAAPE